MDNNKVLKVNDLEIFLNKPLCEKENIFEGLFQGFSNVAVKRVSEDEYPDYKERLEKELEVARDTTFDSNILAVQCYYSNIKCCEKKDNCYYIAYENFTSTLRKVIQEGNPKKYDLKNIMLDVVKCLEKFHNQKDKNQEDLIHRDIRPENLFVLEGKDAICGKISNFALSKRIKKVGFVSSSREFPQNGYVSAELYKLSSSMNKENNESNHKPKKSKKGIGRSTDIFSLGIVMYEVFTLGQHPFRKSANEDPQPNINKHKIVNLKENFLKIKPWEKPLALQLIQCMIHKTPWDRPKARDIIEHPLFADIEKIEKFFVSIQGYFADCIKTGNPCNYREFGNHEINNWHTVVNQDRHVKDAILLESNSTELRPGVFNLFSAIRNLVSHLREPERSKNLREFLKSKGYSAKVTSEGHRWYISSYFLDKFPILLFHAYQMMQNKKSFPGLLSSTPGPSTQRMDTFQEFYGEFNFNKI